MCVRERVGKSVCVRGWAESVCLCVTVCMYERDKGIKRRVIQRINQSTLEIEREIKRKSNYFIST